jgi:YfiH family protein
LYFEEIKKGELVYRTVGNLGAQNAFSTRMSGFSREKHLFSLNFAYGKGDSDLTVDKNYALFLSSIGIDPENRVSGEQVHSANVRTVQISDAGICFPATDGLVTRDRNLALIIKTADCAPVLLCDPENHVIGALHCGWRGTVSGIARAGVEAMKALGADVSKIRVAIGACIHSCCFEVKEDFIDSLKSMAGADFAEKHVMLKDNKTFADLVGMNLELLESAGILAENICTDTECTCCRPDLYFSHRASRGHRGVMCSVIYQ